MAAPSKVAKLPSYTPNNPHGKWIDLPRGKNFMFCGDRILYGSNFNEKIKIQYDNEARVLTVREHCEMRRRELERVTQSRTSEEPTLIQLQYEKLSAFLKKTPGGIKANRMYSLKELRKAMTASEVNDLRAANMMLPLLTQAEFEKLYAGETNNPQFVKTEHERYISNLMTQNPAMLYTANGSLYYFSLNLSNDQLKLMARVLGSGGGSGSSGGGNFAGGRGAGKGSQSENGNSKRLANALEGVKNNPFEGFQTGRNNLSVRPQATILPSSFGVASKATLVPYDMEIPSVSRAQSRGIASTSRSSRGSSERVKAVSVSSNPSLNMMNIGGMGRSNSGTNTASSRPTYQSVASTAPSGKASSTTLPDPTVASPSRAPTAEQVNADLNRSATGPQLRAKTNDVVGPPPVALNDTDFISATIDFATPNYSCKPNQWEQTLYQLNSGNKSIQDSCFPAEDGQILNFKFCGTSGSGMDYTNRCVYNKDNIDKLIIPDGVRSCYDQINTDIGNICRQYFELPNPFTHDDLLLCAERLFVVACEKIPCEIEPQITKNTEGKDVIGELTVKNLNLDSIFTTKENIHPRTKAVSTVVIAKPYEEILNLPHLKREYLHKETATGSKVSLPTANSHWNSELSKDLFKDHLVRVSLFYQSRMNNKCQFEKPREYQISGSQ